MYNEYLKFIYIFFYKNLHKNTNLKIRTSSTSNSKIFQSTYQLYSVENTVS